MKRINLSTRPPKSRIIFIVGPTGSGKTELGLKLAARMPVEFISADSMQIYRGMDIVTDKVPEALRARRRYHLVDILPPTREFNVAAYCRKARWAIRAVQKKKRWPVVVGGTGLYVDSLLYGIFEGGPKDEAVRARITAEIQKRGLWRAHERLGRVDPEAASKIDPSDERRIVRALEVYEATGRPISSLQKERRGLAADHEVLLFGLRRERSELYERIDRRVDFMVNAGLLDEIRSLLKKKLSATAYHCIGVREIEGFLKGRYDLSEAIRLIKRNSRHYAKRQMTWFNKNRDIAWIDVGPGKSLESVAGRIAGKVKG